MVNLDVPTYQTLDSVLNHLVYTRDIYEHINSDHVSLKITFFIPDGIFA